MSLTRVLARLDIGLGDSMSDFLDAFNKQPKAEEKTKLIITITPEVKSASIDTPEKGDTRPRRLTIG
jgi:hypothetical protein